MYRTFRRPIVMAFAAIVAIQASAVNPYLPLWEFIPDGEPYVFEDPDNPGRQRLYIYGSHDTRLTDYCGLEQVVWSAPVDSLDAWRYDGVIFRSTTDADGAPLYADGRGDVLFAPDVAVTVDATGKKTYYLYPNNQAGGRGPMVAKSDRPDGPFEVVNWDTNDPRATVGPLGFDPAVFVDDDGRVYGYWGFGTSHVAELDPSTMATVKPGTGITERMIPGFQDGDGNEFRFFEASSIRKIDGKYVFVYSRMTGDGEFGMPASNYSLAYAYSDNPTGPWTYGGTIIDARGRTAQPDGSTVATATPNGNTHGSLCEINGKWYVFYHRQTGLNEFARQAMVAPVEVTVDPGKGGKVHISEAELTSEGFDTGGLDLFATYPAAIACYFTGPEPAVHAWPEVFYHGPYFQPREYEMEWLDEPPHGTDLTTMPVVNNIDGSTIGYKYFNFDGADGLSEMAFTLGYRPRGIDATVDVMAGAPTEELGGRKIGSVHILPGEALAATTKTVRVKNFDGLRCKQPLFLVVSSDTKGESVCDLYSIGFRRW